MTVTNSHILKENLLIEYNKTIMVSKSRVKCFSKLNDIPMKQNKKSNEAYEITCEADEIACEIKIVQTLLLLLN